MSRKEILTQPVKKVLIDNPTTLDEWAKSLKMFRTNDESRTYVFNLSEFSFYENVNLSTQVDYYTTACGNKTGSFLMTLTFLTTVSAYFIMGGTFSELTVTQLLYCVALTILGAGVGKVIGLLNAHWSLIKLAKDIQRRIHGVYTIKQLKVA